MGCSRRTQTRPPFRWTRRSSTTSAGRPTIWAHWDGGWFLRIGERSLRLRRPRHGRYSATAGAVAILGVCSTGHLLVAGSCLCWAAGLIAAVTWTASPRASSDERAGGRCVSWRSSRCRSSLQAVYSEAFSRARGGDVRARRARRAGLGIPRGRLRDPRATVRDLPRRGAHRLRLALAAAQVGPPLGRRDPVVFAAFPLTL